MYCTVKEGQEYVDKCQIQTNLPKEIKKYHDVLHSNFLHKETNFTFCFYEQILYIKRNQIDLRVHCGIYLGRHLPKCDIFYLFDFCYFYCMHHKLVSMGVRLWG
jgi:hypothetical protein